MKINRIEKINVLSSSDNIESLEKAEQKFIDKEFLTKSDIEEMTKEIAASIANSRDTDKNVLTVVDALTPEKIFRRFPGFIKEVSDADIAPALKRIQRALVDRLASKIDPATFNLIVDRINENNSRVLEMHGNKIFKGGFHLSDGGQPYQEDIPMHQEKAKMLEELYALPERSPYIAYTIEAISDSKGEVEEIQENTDFKSLNTLLESEKPPVKEAVQTVGDVMKGELFLIEHGWILTDNKLKNIGVFKEGKKLVGKLFDFDGFFKLHGTYLAESLYFTAHYVPPELETEAGPIQLEESSVVYEFGECLRMTISFYKETIPVLLQKKIIGLTHKMKEENPEKRISLKASIAELDKILAEAN